MVFSVMPCDGPNSSWNSCFIHSRCLHVLVPAVDLIVGVNYHCCRQEMCILDAVWGNFMALLVLTQSYFPRDGHFPSPQIPRRLRVVCFGEPEVQLTTILSSSGWTGYCLYHQDGAVVLAASTCSIVLELELDVPAWQRLMGRNSAICPLVGDCLLDYPDHPLPF